MENKDVYVWADFMATDVQNLIQELKSRDYTVRLVEDEVAAVKEVSDGREQLIVVLNSGMDVKQLVVIGQHAQSNNSCVYFIGDPVALFAGEAEELEKAPGVHFPGFPLDYELLAAEIESGRREKKRVLVVDDEAIVLRSVKVWLEDTFDISLVNTGELAVEFANKHPVDLMLLDYTMPSMSGPDVLKFLRKYPATRNIPVIFLTGRNDRESIAQIIPLKPDGYILKSEKPEKIKAAVVNYFKTRVRQL